MKITYRQEGDYLLPNLLPPKAPSKPLGKYSRMYLNYLKENKRITYTNLLTSGELLEHAADIGEQMVEEVELLVTQMAKERGVTESLKEIDQMDWVGRMCNIKYCAEEIVFSDFLYNEQKE